MLAPFFLDPSSPQKIWVLISLDQSGAGKILIPKMLWEDSGGPSPTSTMFFFNHFFLAPLAPLWSKLIKAQIFLGGGGGKKKLLESRLDLVKLICIIFGA